jgi:hypothetical protein
MEIQSPDTVAGRNGASNSRKTTKRYYEATTVHPKTGPVKVWTACDLVETKRENWWGWRESNPRPKV